MGEFFLLDGTGFVGGSPGVDFLIFFAPSPRTTSYRRYYYVLLSVSVLVRTTYTVLLYIYILSTTTTIKLYWWLYLCLFISDLFHIFCLQYSTIFILIVRMQLLLHWYNYSLSIKLHHFVCFFSISMVIHRFDFFFFMPFKFVFSSNCLLFTFNSLLKLFFHYSLFHSALWLNFSRKMELLSSPNKFGIYLCLEVSLYFSLFPVPGSLFTLWSKHMSHMLFLFCLICHQRIRIIWERDYFPFKSPI